MNALALAILIPCYAVVQTPQSSAPNFVLTPEVRKQTVLELSKMLEDRYVEEATAKKISTELKKKLNAGEFDKFNSGDEFGAHINQILKGMVTDAHLRFRFSEKPLPKRERPSEPSPDEIKRQEEEARFVNHGWEEVKRLRGNVGYIKFNYFDEPESIKKAVAAAYGFLANTDALIIDLRDNGGGSPAGVQLVCSYLFGEKPVHLNSLYFREGNTTREFWTLKNLDAPRYLNREVYVLTSKRTGSGAEECAYNIQTQKRGTIVGSSTWGGANPGGMVRLNDHFGCFIPVGKAINPITKTNWEGVGVKPDIEIEPAKALKHAQLLAIKAMIAKTTDPEKKADLQGIYRSLQTEGEKS